MKTRNIVIGFLGVVTIFLVGYCIFLQNAVTEIARDNFILKQYLYAKSDSLMLMQKELDNLEKLKSDSL